MSTTPALKPVAAIFQGGILKPNGMRNSPKTLIAPSQKTYATRFCVPFFCSRALSHTRDAPMIA